MRSWICEALGPVWHRVIKENGSFWFWLHQSFVFHHLGISWDQLKCDVNNSLCTCDSRTIDLLFTCTCVCAWMCLSTHYLPCTHACMHTYSGDLRLRSYVDRWLRSLQEERVCAFMSHELASMSEITRFLLPRRENVLLWIMGPPAFLSILSPPEGPDPGWAFCWRWNSQPRLIQCHSRDASNLCSWLISYTSPKSPHFFFSQADRPSAGTAKADGVAAALSEQQTVGCCAGPKNTLLAAAPARQIQQKITE